MPLRRFIVFCWSRPSTKLSNSILHSLSAWIPLIPCIHSIYSFSKAWHRPGILWGCSTLRIDIQWSKLRPSFSARQRRARCPSVVPLSPCRPLLLDDLSHYFIVSCMCELFVCCCFFFSPWLPWRQRFCLPWSLQLRANQHKILHSTLEQNLRNKFSLQSLPVPCILKTSFSDKICHFEHQSNLKNFGYLIAGKGRGMAIILWINRVYLPQKQFRAGHSAPE